MYYYYYYYYYYYPDGITHNQIGHVLVDKRRQSSKIHVRSLRGADCDTYYYLVVATIVESLSLKKGIKQHLVADRYNLNRLVDRETRKEYQIDVANRFSALEGLEIEKRESRGFLVRSGMFRIS